MVLRQPLTDVGRHQERLLAITRDKALSHAPNRLKPPGRHLTYATASGESSSSREPPRVAFGGVPDEQPRYLYDGISSAGISRAAALLWPDWVEVEGCVLRREMADEENVRQWMATEGGSVQRTEWVVNHVHLYDEVEQGWEEPRELLDERLLAVAERLAAAWRASLAAAFPSRVFHVEVAGAEEDYGPTVYAFSAPSSLSP